MYKITISNLKGGVGKTTTTVNLAYSFMQLGKKILVVDADPQANATPFFLPRKTERSIKDVYRNPAHVKRSIYRTRYGNIDVIPGSTELEEDDASQIDVIKKALDTVADRYDICLIDTRPAFEQLTITCICAADLVLTPVCLNKFCRDNLSVVDEKINGLRYIYPVMDGELMEPVCSPVWKVFATMVNSNRKANMRVDFDSFKNTSTVATGWVEIEGIFKFPVSVRKWFDDKSGKEMMFVSYPQRKDGDRYSGVVYPHDREVRNEIDRVVLEVTKEKLFAETVPDVNIDDVRITPLNQKTGSVVQKLGIASIKMYGMTVNGIVIKEGRKGRFVQMPQYQTQGQYRDTVYGVTAAIQRKIEERVLLEYDKIIRAQEEVNMQEVQETKINQEIELTDEYRRQVSAIYDYENRNNIPENDRMTKWYDEMNAAVAKPWYKENDTGRVPISESTIAARYAEISGEQQTARDTQAIQEEQKKAEEAEKKIVDAVITFTVAESSEFHGIGTYIDNIPTVEEAIEKFNQIDPARLHGIPAIGINYHVKGTDSIEDEQADIVMGKIIDVPSLNSYPDMRDNETVKAAVEKLIEAYPESLVLSPTEDEVMQTLNMAGVAADRKRLDGIYSGTEDREEYIQYLKSLRENYVENDPDEIKMSYLDKAITYVGQIRKPKTSQDENKGIDGAEDAAEIQEDEEPMYSSADVITLMPNFFAEKNRDGVRFAIKNTKLNIDNPIIVGKYIRAQCFTIENGNDKVFARFQNELNGMEHMRTGPLLIRQQIVMQVFKDGVPQPPYLYASYKSDNVTEALEHYNECKGWWTDLTGQTTAEIFQRAKTMENKQDVKQNVKQNKPRL